MLDSARRYRAAIVAFRDRRCAACAAMVLKPRWRSGPARGRWAVTEPDGHRRRAGEYHWVNITRIGRADGLLQMSTGAARPGLMENPR